MAVRLGSAAIGSACLVSFVAFGCTGPVVTIAHHLPAPVPVVEPTDVPVVGSFEIDGPAAGDLAGLAREALAERRPQILAATGAPSARGTVRIDARATVASRDVSGTRIIRQWAGEPHQLVARRVPTLIRKELTIRKLPGSAVMSPTVPFSP